MAFLLDDQLSHDARFKALRKHHAFADALALYVLLGVHAASDRSDGRIIRGVARGLAPSSLRTDDALAALVGVEFVVEDADADEFVLPDFLTLNESRERMQERRRKNREKSTKSYQKWKARAVDATSDHDSDRSESASSDTSYDRSPVPVPVPSLPSGEGGSLTLAPATAPKSKRPRTTKTPKAEDATSARVAEMISTTRQAAGGVPFVPSKNNAGAIRDLVAWAEKSGLGFDGLERALAGFWRTKGTAAPIAWLAEDPGRWLGGARRKSNDLEELEQRFCAVDRAWNEAHDRDDRDALARLTPERNELERRLAKLRRAA